MITVRIDGYGNVVYNCEDCGKYTRVQKSWSESPFWEMFNGQAVLIMLGHLEKDHSRGNTTKSRT